MVHRFTFFRKIDLAVVYGCGCRIKPSDELVILVNKRVEFVPELRFLSFLHPGSVKASPGLCLITPGRVGRCMTGI